MGLSYTVHVGPYVRCRVDKVEVIERRQTCPAPGCREHGRGLASAFCPACGAAVAPDVPFPRPRDAVDAWEVGERIGGALSHIFDASGEFPPAGVHLWAADVDREGDPSFSFSPKHDDPFARDLSDIDPPGECNAFARAFAAELAALREAYGAENVEIRWGVIHEVN